MRKHSEEAQKIKQLEDIIKKKDREIKDIKNSLAEILLQIRNLNNGNNCGDSSVIKRKISELCTNTRYELLVDEIDSSYKKQTEKIIELYP